MCIRDRAGNEQRVSKRLEDAELVQPVETAVPSEARSAEEQKKVQMRRQQRQFQTEHSPERKLRFSALCREAGQPPAEVLRQLIDRGTVRARITREQLDFMAQLKGVARNLNQLTRLANAKGLAAVRVRHAAIVTAIEKLLKQICDGR